MHVNEAGLKLVLMSRKKATLEQVRWAERKVDALIEIELNNNQYSALVSIVNDIARINAGSRLIKLVNDGKFLEASLEFENWSGNKRRRSAERRLFLRPCLVVHNIKGKK